MIWCHFIWPCRDSFGLFAFMIALPSYDIQDYLDLSENYPTALYYMFNTMLLMLLVFHIYWWVLICSMIWRQLKNRGKVGEDIRSGKLLLYTRLIWLILSHQLYPVVSLSGMVFAFLVCGRLDHIMFLENSFNVIFMLQFPCT